MTRDHKIDIVRWAKKSLGRQFTVQKGEDFGFQSKWAVFNPDTGTAYDYDVVREISDLLRKAAR